MSAGALKDLTLAIDVGTGSVRAALVDTGGTILAIEAVEGHQSVPAFGWAEQSAEGWWDGVVRVTRAVLDRTPGASGRVEAVCACGQMHGTVLVDADGRPTRDAVPLWNDKRTLDEVAGFEASHRPEDYLPATGNPATPAWPGFKLAWLRDNDPDAYGRATHVLMPKDFVNFRLTGERGDGPGRRVAELSDGPHARANGPPPWRICWGSTSPSSRPSGTGSTCWAG